MDADQELPDDQLPRGHTPIWIEPPSGATQVQMLERRSWGGDTRMSWWCKRSSAINVVLGLLYFYFCFISLKVCQVKVISSKVQNLITRNYLLCLSASVSANVDHFLVPFMTVKAGHMSQYESSELNDMAQVVASLVEILTLNEDMD